MLFFPHCGRLGHDSKMGKEDTDEMCGRFHTLLVAVQALLRRVSVTHCSGEAVERISQGDNEAGSDVTFVRDEVLISQIKKNLRREEL